MANRNDYTITTLSSSIRQFDACTRNNAIVAPFGKATNTANNLKIRYNTPYIAGPLNPPETGSVYTPPVVNYALPFSYYRFEVSSSTNVAQVLGEYEYTGSFTKTTGPNSYSSYYGYSDTYVFSGSYAVRFPLNASDYAIDLGAIQNRSGWGTLLSGSFSFAAWIYPERTEQYRYIQCSLFGMRTYGGDGFSFLLGRGTVWGEGNVVVNSSWSSPSQGSGQNKYSHWASGSATFGQLNYQGWNHIVFVVEGNTSATNRRIKAYVNNNDYGYVDEDPFNTTGPGGRVNENYFVKNFRTDQQIYLGAELGQGPYAMDEVSIWSKALTTEDVNTLYNAGSGKYAIGTIESGSTGGC